MSYVDLLNETSLTGDNIVVDYLTVNNDVSIGGALTLSALTASSVLALSSTKAVTGLSLTDGQLLIGRTGLTPLPASITGTTDQVTVTTASGTITMGAPQNIATTSSPTFSKLTLSSAVNGLTLGNLTLSAAMSSARNYAVPDVGAGTAYTVMTLGSQSIGGTKTFLSAPVLGTLTASSILGLDSSKVATSYSLTDGQLLIGRTGLTPLPASITGTTDRVLVTSGSGSISLSTPQDIATTSSPTFASLILGTANTITISASAPSSSRVYTMTDVGSSASFVMTSGSQSIGGAKTFTAQPSFTGVNIRGVLYTGAAGQLGSRHLNSGEILIGRSDETPRAASLTGTANQVIVTNGYGTITLSLPQDIGTASSPVFNTLNLWDSSDQLTFGSGFTTIHVPQPSSVRRYIVPDAGANCEFVMGASAQTIAGVKTFSSYPVISAGSAYGLLGLDAGSAMTSYSLTDGQLLIGRTGSSPLAASLTGTSSQVIVTGGSGSINLSLPQSIATTSSPTFADITDTGIIGQSIVLVDNSNRFVAANFASTNGVAMSVSANTLTVDTPQNLQTTASPTFAGVTLATTGGTALTLDYYEEYAHGTSWSGPIVPPVHSHTTVLFTRIGRIVTISLPIVTEPGNSVGAVLRMDSAVPARFCPVAEVYFWGVSTQNDGVDSAGYFLVRQVGSDQQFYYGQGLSTIGGIFPANTGTTGVPSRQSFTYRV